MTITKKSVNIIVNANNKDSKKENLDTVQKRIVVVELPSRIYSKPIIPIATNNHWNNVAESPSNSTGIANIIAIKQLSTNPSVIKRVCLTSSEERMIANK